MEERPIHNPDQPQPQQQPQTQPQPQAPSGPLALETAGYFWFAPLTLVEKISLLGFPLLFIGVFVRSFFDASIHPIRNLWWVFTFTMGALGRPFILSRRQALGRLLNNFAAQEPSFSKMFDEFVESEDRRHEPEIVGALGGGAFLVFRLAVSWEVLHLIGTPAFWFSSFFFSFGLGLFSRAVWMFLTFGRLVNRMSMELERIQDRLFSWELLESAGKGYARTSLGASLLSFSLFWMAYTNSLNFTTDLESIPKQIIFMESVLALAILVPLAYLLIPQWRLHRILVKRKLQIKDLFFSEFIGIEREFLKNPRREMAEKYISARQVIQEIDQLPEWPFRLENIMPILTVVAIPLVFFFKEILVDVIVNLIRK